MHPNEQLIRNLYAAFDRKDYAAMSACYHPDAEFSDPVFTDLRGKKRISAMWHMLCEGGKDLRIICDKVSVDDENGECSWEALYTFSATGKKVHNKIISGYMFKEGLIIQQEDYFDLHKWASMAMGWKGNLLGWLSSVQNKIRATGEHRLEHFIKKHPEYS